MAEQCKEKRKLKRSFLIVSSVSKFFKLHGMKLLILALIVVVIISIVLQIMPEPQPEPKPSVFEEFKQGADSFWMNTKSTAEKAWGGVTGFFGNIGTGIVGGFTAIGNFFGKLF